MARLIHELPQTCVSLDHQLIRELNLCVEFLVDDEMDPSDVATASHWLRESPDRAELRKINAMGLEVYREHFFSTFYKRYPQFKRQEDAIHDVIEHDSNSNNKSGSKSTKNTETYSPIGPPIIDPRLVAAHLKYVCQQFPYGLITDAVRDALLELMPSDVRTDADWQPNMPQINTIRLLLQTNMVRLRLLDQIMRVIRRILQVQQVDQITPLGLAVLLPITSGSEVTNIALLKRWHICLSTLLSRVWGVFNLTRKHTMSSLDDHDWKWIVELNTYEEEKLPLLF
ncbi:hypothetical protein BDF22DRAFT_657401 [Syncephalis plumigaleata]|nr:hypothetical protein BDF22DRAFT_657401 [Syncephalis plumigaleata]